MRRGWAWKAHERILARVSGKAVLRRLAHDDFLRFHPGIIRPHEVTEYNTYHYAIAIRIKDINRLILGQETLIISIFN